MALFDALIEDVKSRFSLGSQAAPLIQELLRQIAGDPGGVDGFLDKFRASGLAPQVSSWLGKPDSNAIAPHAVEKALRGGAATIEKKTGLGSGIVAAALGYAIPRIIGLLTPGGLVPTSIPASVASFLEGPITATPSPSRAHSMFRRVESAPRRSLRGEDTSGVNRWIFPGVAALLATGFVAHFVPKQAKPPVVATPAQSTSAASTPAPVETAPAETAPRAPARLALSNADGAILFSGVVADNATRDSIIDSLKTVLGPNKVSGNLAVEAHTAAPPWLPKLQAALAALNISRSKAVFEGNTLSVGGVIPDAAREEILATLKSIFGNQFEFANLSRVATKPVTDLSAPQSGFSGKDLVGVLNKTVLNFATGSAEVEASSKPLLTQAANLIKQLPAGTVVHISGYTDSRGDPAANLVLSQHRADSVRQILVDAGADPASLIAKGYGSGNASGSDAGQLNERRIEFSVGP